MPIRKKMQPSLTQVFFFLTKEGKKKKEKKRIRRERGDETLTLPKQDSWETLDAGWWWLFLTGE